MTKRLGESDRRAADLLLDRTANAGGSYVAHAEPGTEPGIQGVQRVLSLLDHMPAEEPAADLMARTLARINSSGVMAPLHPATAALMTDRPHA